MVPDVRQKVLATPRVVGLDFDGTCANPDGTGNCRVSPRIRTAVQSVDHAKTASIVLVTSRPLQGAEWAANALGLRNGVTIADQGAVIRSTTALGSGQGTTLRELRISPDVAWRCLQLAEIHGCYFQLEDMDGLSGLRPNLAATSYSKYVFAPLTVFSGPDMNSRTKRGALAAIFFRNSPSSTAEIASSLRDDFGGGIDITATASGRVEVRHAEATKGAALDWVCRSHLDVPMEERAAIGDGPADATMLAAVRTGVAVRSDRLDVAQLRREAVATCASPECAGVADAMSSMGLLRQLTIPGGPQTGGAVLDR
jgi:hydroxymethylpyrimidine pyrophosphatase-like HAD family hydrolase